MCDPQTNNNSTTQECVKIHIPRPDLQRTESESLEQGPAACFNSLPGNLDSVLVFEMNCGSHSYPLRSYLNASSSIMPSHIFTVDNGLFLLVKPCITLLITIYRCFYAPLCISHKTLPFLWSLCLLLASLPEEGI